MKDGFCFVTCVRNEDMYGQCLEHIRMLDVPQGLAVETRKIVGASSIMSAYNEAMRSSDARYKVYLHQDTFILNRRFLYHLLHLFARPKIGLVGMMGGTVLPKSGVWFHDGLHCFGKIMRWGHRGGILNRWIPRKWNPDKLRYFAYLPVVGEYKSVLCVDGLLMATQYDIPWREDLYGGFIYYEAPHCLEFIKRGYEVVVPRQVIPWSFHRGANRTAEEDREYHAQFREVLQVFKREYAPFIGKHIREIGARRKLGGFQELNLFRDRQDNESAGIPGALS